MEQRRRAVAAILAVLVLVAIATAIGLVTASSGKTPPSSTQPPGGSGTTSSTDDPYAAAEAAKLSQAEGEVNLSLPNRTGEPAPSLPAQAFRHPLGSQEVVGFVPYYELTNLDNESLSGFTYLVYSSVDVAGSGTIIEQSSTDGWGSVVNGGASALVSAGHADGDRVLLSLFADSESVIGPLCTHGASTGARLAAEVGPVLVRYGFDGVDLDIEGQDTSDRPGYVQFVKAFSTKLQALDSSWSIMANVYPQSAEDPTNFFDVKALARYVGRFFVMAYDMDSTEIASASAPLTGSSPSDAEALASFAAAKLGPQTILGVPFYGYDFPASSSSPGAPATGSPYSVSYNAIVTSFSVNHHKAVWDPATETPYTVFDRAGQWHQTWFDDPASIALKVALASSFHVAGVGAWELGMAAAEPQMAAVLDGDSAAVKLPLARQP